MFSTPQISWSSLKSFGNRLACLVWSDLVLGGIYNPYCRNRESEKTQVGPPVPLSTWFFFTMMLGKIRIEFLKRDFFLGGSFLGTLPLQSLPFVTKGFKHLIWRYCTLWGCWSGVNIPLQLVSTSILGTWIFFARILPRWIATQKIRLTRLPSHVAHG